MPNKKYLDQKAFIKQIYYTIPDCTFMDIHKVYFHARLSKHRPSLASIRVYLKEYENDLPEKYRGKRNKVKFNKHRKDNMYQAILPSLNFDLFK